MAKKKTKPASNPNRGFATTSVASKPKPAQQAPTATPTQPPPPPKEAPTWVPPTPEEEAEAEFQKIIDKFGARIRREAARIAAKAETERRTMRGSGMYYPLKLDRIFGLSASTREESGGEEALGEKVLRLVRKEYQRKREGEERVEVPDEALLGVAWTVWGTCLKLGLGKGVVERAVASVLGRRRGGAWDAEEALEECLEWIMLFGEREELPGFFEVGEKKGEGKVVTPSTSGTSTPAKVEGPAAKEKDTRHLKNPISAAKPPPPTSSKTDLADSISKLQLESKDISDQGEDLTCSSEGSSSDEFDSELTPETLIPAYIQLQTKLYKIHPTVASTVTGGKKAKGGGRKPTTVRPAPPPANLPEAQKKKVKVLHQRLRQFESDPLFDQYEADTAWRDARGKLEEEGFASKPKKRTPAKTTPPPPEAKKAEDSDDEGGLMGGLFEGPATEEEVAPGEVLTIRDFEEAPATTTSFAKKAGQGKAGVGAATLRKLVQDICKSRDVNSKVTFSEIPGTSLSNRCRLTITWSSKPEILPTPAFTSPEDAPEVIIRLPTDTTSVFEMKRLAAASKDQAEGYIITFALFTLYARKEEKLYLRLPTIWRNVWAELVEADRMKSEAEERKVLEHLKKLLSNPQLGSTTPSTEPAAKLAAAPAAENGDQAPAASIPKPAYERYLEGEVLSEDWQRRRSTPAFQQMESFRRNLPMWSFRDSIIAAVESNPVIVLCGETGCGKSTQLPAFLMEHELSSGRDCKIYCTEPRRISALSLAKRVAEEMGDGKRGAGGLVGYAIRLENCVSEKTKLVYATTGIVMRMLERSRNLEGITHLVLDEVHERSIESDFLLVVLKRLLVKRKDLKVVLMSATVNAERFSDYLGGAPILRVPGRTFPVDSFFLEDAIEVTGYVHEDDPRSRNRRNNQDWDDNDADVEVGDDSSLNTTSLASYSPQTRSTLTRLDLRRIPYDLILSLLTKLATSPEYITYSSAILIFLPGLSEIRRLNDMILSHPTFSPRSPHSSGSWQVFLLHSTIPPEDQEAAFLLPPPGTRKLVLATNIAETGITIPDITAVIDTGKHKEMRYDEKRQLSRLIETFISRANAKQRRGRAGRVQKGLCFHLFTKSAFETRLAEEQTPEIMRLSLQDLVLRVKICALGQVEEVLTSALDSPTPKNIRRAVDSLIEIRALTASEELTSLGRQLSKLPLDVYLGKLVLLSSTPLYRCVDAAVTIAALLSSKSPFLSPIGYTTEAAVARSSFRRGDSDLLTAYNAYLSWRRVISNKTVSEAEWCRKSYLSSRTLSSIEDLKLQLFSALADAGHLPLSGEEKQHLSRCRYSGSNLPPSRRPFFDPPETSSCYSTSDPIVSAAITAAFYPHLLLRASPHSSTFTSLTNPGSTIKPHSTSVNRTPLGDSPPEWISYYTQMSTRGGKSGSDAHETTRAEPVVVAVGCGEMEWRGWAGVGVVDGRVRFGVGKGREGGVVRGIRAWREGIESAVWRGKKEARDEEVDKEWEGIWREVLIRSWNGPEVGK